MSTRTAGRSGARPRNKQAPRKRAAARRSSVFWALVTGIVVLFALAIVLTRSSGENDPDVGGVSETRAVDISGSALPTFSDRGADRAVGMGAPQVKGRDFYGNRVSIGNDGRAKAIVLLAHWCPHCQAEVPEVQGWINTNGMPEGVDFYSVSTSVDAGLSNYPPSEWLKREGWTLPVVVDDTASSIAEAFGMSGTPFWVFVNSDGTVAARAAGAIGVAGIESHLASIGG